MGLQPGTGSAAYCSAVSFRQASSILSLAQRLNANSEAKSSCMVPSLAGTRTLYARLCNGPYGEGAGRRRDFARQATTLLFGARFHAVDAHGPIGEGHG